MQIGFDQGFDRGLQLGKVCGSIYAKAISAVQPGSVDNTEMALNSSQLEVILMDTIPDDLEVCERSIRDLEQLLVKFKCDATEELKTLGELLER